MTKEHVLPAWLGRLYEGQTDFLNEATNSDGTIAYQYKSKAFDYTINDVCMDCNSGWMSQIENDVQPILTKMLREKSFVLDKKKQQKLATWAMKTMLVANHNNPPKPAEQFIPKEHYHAFYQQKQAMPDNILLLGHIPGRRFAPGAALANSRLTIGEHIQVHKELVEEFQKKANAGRHTYGATFRIGNTVFQLIGHNLVDDSAHKVEMLIPPEPLRVLSPFSNKIRWPLPHSINEFGGLEVIHNALKGTPT